MLPHTQDLPGVSELQFPSDFWWGAATAAYQIEGATTADGRGPSVWDTFCRVPGNVLNGHTGDPAADHYRRYRDDVALMAELGLNAYRGSVSWSRVLPAGSGQVSAPGLGFYDQLVDELLARDIRPVLTLYHWDLPQALEDQGGWVARDTAYHFADYARILGERLGDRVALWCTVNEPWCSAFLGYGSGVHAPGREEGPASLAAAHHLMLGHGLAAQAIRSVHSRAQISAAINQGAVRAISEDPADLDAARRIDGLLNRLFLEPVLKGRYPADVLEDTAAICDWSFVKDGDLTSINAPLDLLGFNYYQPDLVGVAAEPAKERWPFPGSERVAFHTTPGPLTDMGWTVDPTGLRDILFRLRRDHPEVPLLITENGAAFPDHVSPDGTIDDSLRIDYLRRHLEVAHEAIIHGVDLRGYFVWSLLDNFEWGLGYSKRFGIVHVDYETQRRTPKASAHWYRELIRSQSSSA